MGQGKGKWGWGGKGRKSRGEELIGKSEGGTRGAVEDQKLRRGGGKGTERIVEGRRREIGAREEDGTKGGKPRAVWRESN